MSNEILIKKLEQTFLSLLTTTLRGGDSGISSTDTYNTIGATNDIWFLDARLLRVTLLFILRLQIWNGIRRIHK